MGSSRPIVVINVVGLTPHLLDHAEHIKNLGHAHRAWSSPVPAVTCTSQASMLTGQPPRVHGVVGNGWFYRDTEEIRFWQQAASLVQAPMIDEQFETARMFWWFNQSSASKYSATPKPHYGCDGSKVFGILDHTGCDLEEHLGPFPFFTFWGPGAGLPCSDWIARASARVIQTKTPELTLVYLPHLDYDFQRFDDHNPDRVREVDKCLSHVIEAAQSVNAHIVIVSEYGLVKVNRAVCLNRELRKAGYLSVRSGPFGEMLMPGESRAFAVVDHQVAHIYVPKPEDREPVQKRLQDVEGVDAVVDPGELSLDHPRSGELIALSNHNAWFAYDYWLDESQAPDFAPTVDIHRKPGYDPRELFMTSKLRAAARLAQKKLGLRYKMDVIPLDNSLVRGSHGIQPSDPNDGPLIIGPQTDSIELPGDMQGFPDYLRALRGRAT
ncbi:MAG: nucleotide pyrophosphatase/phosphodiesterase family protein [Planctomycetota bacterium]